MEILSSESEFMFWFKSYVNLEKFNVTVMRYYFIFFHMFFIKSYTF